MKALRVQVTIGKQPRRCRHTERHEAEICVGCVRKILGHLLEMVGEAQTSEDDVLALGLIGQAVEALDRSLAGVSMIAGGQVAERSMLGGYTADELEQVTVYGYTLPQLAKAVTIVRELGLEQQLEMPVTKKRRWRR